jgi:hypothetical protein
VREGGENAGNELCVSGNDGGELFKSGGRRSWDGIASRLRWLGRFVDRVLLGSLSNAPAKKEMVNEIGSGSSP